MIQEIQLDKFCIDLHSWMALIDQARKNTEGKIVPSFIEIISQINADLDPLLSAPLNLMASKSIFVGISIIQYLDRRYAIEKIMLFAKGRCHTSVPSPAERIQILLQRFRISLEEAKMTEWDKIISQSLLFFLFQDFKAARAVLLPYRKRFRQQHTKESLSLIELILFSLIKRALIPKVTEILNESQQNFAHDPLSLYFSILRSHLSEIEAILNQKKAGINYLKTLFDNLSQLEKTN